MLETNEAIYRTITIMKLTDMLQPSLQTGTAAYQPPRPEGLKKIK